MLETLKLVPFAFWVSVALLVWGAALAIKRLGDGTGFPMLIVLGTVTAWYIGDAFYNDYGDYHVKIFSAETLNRAWWQVAWFILCFLWFVPGIHRQFNASLLTRRSGVLKLFKFGVNQPDLQSQLGILLAGSAAIWLLLALIAAIRLRGEVLYYFFPFLGYKAEPWGRDRIGSGIDALLSVAFYFQLLVTGIFGVVAALSVRSGTRTQALLFCFLSLPYFIFDRTRNTMLAAVMPGVLSFALIRVRGGIFKKLIVLGVAFLIINAWMGFVIANRATSSITSALMRKGFDFDESEQVHHEGLNMFEELCWINKFMGKGTFSPSWGGRYFAEVVNVVPRALWHGKPMIGIDYAIARGQGGGAEGSAGVYSTVSTGLIGQGVVNFGQVVGPAAAALLMSFWVAVLARLDLGLHRVGRLPLYGIGIILTFNMGRDITLLTLYPFLFGFATIWWFDRGRPVQSPPQYSNQPARVNARTGMKARRAGPRSARRTSRFMRPN